MLLSRGYGVNPAGQRDDFSGNRWGNELTEVNMRVGKTNENTIVVFSIQKDNLAENDNGGGGADVGDTFTEHLQ